MHGKTPHSARNQTKDWITESSTLDYENPFMRIVKNIVIRPNGYKAPYYVLDRPTFSIIIPLTSDQQTYMVSQYRYPIKTDSLEFPMGNVSVKDPLKVAQQELLEETGLTAKKWTAIGHWAISPGHNSQWAHLYVAQDLKEGTPAPEPGEILTIKKYPISEVGNLIAKKVIIDGPTICAFHYLELYLKQNTL